MPLFKLRQQVAGFIVEDIEEIADIHGTAYILRHKNSGARYMHLDCDDNNKAFAIGFKTPPKDDTGVFHILEHSVLCGSKKYPVKEPFVDLIKTSMQTFLNAMTFSDKTLYPVASTNEADLINLMDVYMDAVLSPAIYTKPSIFLQEGWHYELKNKRSNLTYNGVVFNEMKGALSDPSDVLDHAVNQALFPDTTYSYESGGDPQSIPTLSYEQFLDAHARHYTLNNAYIITYGNINAIKILEHLDQEYLSVPSTYTNQHFSANPGNPNECNMQQPVIARKTVQMATTEDNAQVALAMVIGPATNRERIIASDILFEALLGSNEAPIKKALLDAHLGCEVTSYVNAHCLQPYQIIQLRSSKPHVAEKFRAIIVEESKKLIQQGIPRDRLEATLASNEFELRQRDFGYPDGVVLAMDAMSTWIYDDNSATLGIKYESIFNKLHDELHTDYFENLLNQIVLCNNHWALVDLKPVKQDSAHDEEQTLAKIKESMSEEDLDKVISNVEDLRIAQETPDSQEAINTLPRLTRSDIHESKPEPLMNIDTSTPIPTLFHKIATNQLAYALVYFDLSHLSYQDLPYVTILIHCLGHLDTIRMSAAELDNYLTANLGFLSFSTEVYSDSNPHTVTPKIVCSSGAISEKIESLATIPAEVWSTTQFEDTNKIRNILSQLRISLEYNFLNNGHLCATQRAMSYVSPSAVVNQKLTGVDFYFFLRDLIANFDDRKDDLVLKLKNLSHKIFVSDNAYVSFTGSIQDCKKYWDSAQDLRLNTAHINKNSSKLTIPKPKDKHEAFIIPSSVSYSAIAHDPRLLHITTNGMWAPAMNALSYDYLWNEVRVKGGAYGCNFRCSANRQLSFSSYRDPHIDTTLDAFYQAGKWLKQYQPSNEALEGFIVSSVASHDAPTKPYETARRQDAAFFSQRPKSYRAKMRNEILDTSLDNIHIIGDKISLMTQVAPSCVFSNKDILLKSKQDFCAIELLN